MSNPMLLTLVYADCARCGSTSETVQRDRELSANAVCCEIAELMAMDSREPYGHEEYWELLEPEVECYYCGERTRSPFRIGTKVFCCKACGSDYAE